MNFSSYLIIGSGVAGLTFALKMAERFPNKKITIITKSNADESNTKYAQGGIAIVTNTDDDSYQKHIDDTLICGDGLCDLEVVKMVVKEGPKQLKELIKWGAKFDKNKKGNFDLGKEGGHSQNRVVHHKDQTGQEIERAILRQVQNQKNITIFDHLLALDLIIEKNRCLGVLTFNEKTKTILTFPSDYTLLATGGIGHLYGHTTNPVIATGDGIAMAFRAGAKIKDMEFIQFHPTAFYTNDTVSKFLISEAVRGFGSYLRTKKGDRFMLKYDKRGELASRDIVSQCIELELKQSGDHCVFLDCTHLNIEAFIKHFPMIYNFCKNNEIDIEKDWIPVIPAQHYLCGGIVVDKKGKTSIENLFACGECSRTGLHGANRLASNSLLEALVYSDKIFNYIAQLNENNTTKTDFKFLQTETSDNNLEFILKIKSELQLLMRQCAGITRKDTDLIKAQNQLSKWENKIVEFHLINKMNADSIEVLNMILVGSLIVKQSIERHENRGGFIKTV